MDKNSLLSGKPIEAYLLKKGAKYFYYCGENADPEDRIEERIEYRISLESTSTLNGLFNLFDIKDAHTALLLDYPKDLPDGVYVAFGVLKNKWYVELRFPEDFELDTICPFESLSNDSECGDLMHEIFIALPDAIEFVPLPQ